MGQSGKYENGEIVVCKDKWKRRGTQRKFSVTSVPILRGKLVAIPNGKIGDHVSVTVELNKVDKNNSGTLTCTYRQGCFNCFGFSAYELFDF